MIMKQGWEIKKLGDICDIVNGSTPLRTNKDFWEGGDFPWFTIDDIREQGRIISDTKQKVTQAALKKLRVLPVDTILLCCTASIGEYAITEIELTTNQQFNGLVIKNKKEMYPMFLLYFSSTLKDTLSNLSGKATIDFIPISRLKDIEIPIPPLPEQQRIVSILDEAFAAIAKAKANAEQNLKNAKELFESYLQGVFENKGVNWEEKTLGEVLVKTETTDPTKKPNDEFIYLDVSSVNKETKEIENATVLLGKDAPSRARKLIKTNDVIFATVRPTHSRVALITDEYDNQVCSTGYFVLRAKEILSNNLVFYFLLTYSFNKQMEKLQKGASYPAVTDSEVKGIYIPFPKLLKEQQDIVTKLDALSSETKKLEAIYQQKISDLEELKKSVLQKAFSGELKTNAVAV